jgi:hypothetical protein
MQALIKRTYVAFSEVVEAPLLLSRLVDKSPNL